MAFYDEYTWILALTVVFAFGTAVGIGANDISNSFATSVASGALSLAQIVVIGGLCEFLGAVLLGAGVTSTIKSGVAKLSSFQDTPTLLMYGFMCVSLTSSIWDNLASQLALPVSMTHTTVGATVGMALAMRGGGAVIWSQEQDDFPYIKGMVPIFLSWVVSPVMSAIICTILFLSIRTFILRTNNSFMKAFYTLPLFVGGMFWLIVAFIIQTGAKNGTWTDRSDGFAAWVGAVFGVGSALFTVAVIMPILRRNINAADDRATKLGEEHGADAEALQNALIEDQKNGPFNRLKNKIPENIRNSRIVYHLFYNVTRDINDHITTDKHVQFVHENAEAFDPKTEMLFRYLQVFSACVMSFTHGANDVSNAMGPFAAVYQIWETGKISKSVSVEEWILVVGGVGIVVGLAFFSHKVIRCMGTSICKMTAARGFCAELATAITVAIASRYGLPVSTTQTITGALLAIGLMEGLKGVNWRSVGRIFSGWVATLFIACGLAAGFTAFGVNSPNRSDVDQIQAAAEAYNTTNTAMLAQLQAASAPGVAALNETFYSVYEPVEARLDEVVAANLDIFAAFNRTLFAR
mmetsp:Transcript_3963/g.11520  ORF Transcript_3963/g.11520 Transcript_3963/m.11520 type:complete len:579 (+) Transcript_3963:262-1998(+)|eukprot:CAMPEP_0206138802 /NCGR_PEP_ID=MMETSP1473-20131121/3700_1 /ASSEMBLY_ACC=CAM_ASM_001109 /TAXON_ID=1461547 /ORGANISM="Stichococcus sp, Strain RCC1054" /LENGTH=578 /DNA_ID=CAMNT_0053532327 /DNA_START=242 /DNA_END=1978 /DNA_ORIENTATION=+